MTYRQRLTTNKAYKTEEKKAKKEAPKFDPHRMAEFCNDKSCKWCRNVNFGNGVHIPHCLLRGGEVRPHDRCKHLTEFVEYVRSLNIEDLEVEKVKVDIEEEEEEKI